MRDIKFRAWDTDVIRSGFMVYWDDFKYIIIDDFLNSKKRILMQFTGLQDKNGKDIYEGDIVRNHGHANDGIVMFGRFVQKAQSNHDRPYWCEGFYVKRGIETTSLLGMKWRYNGVNISESEDTLEIVGTVCENPEWAKVLES